MNVDKYGTIITQPQSLSDYFRPFQKLEICYHSQYLNRSEVLRFECICDQLNRALFRTPDWSEATRLLAEIRTIIETMLPGLNDVEDFPPRLGACPRILLGPDFSLAL